MSSSVVKKDKNLFIYFEGKIYILFYENNYINIRLKKPSEETTNNICLLLHHNKNTKKSGYIVNEKSENINENFVLTEATKRLGVIDSTTVHILKTEVDNTNIYYYTSKFEIERLFVDYEFSDIYPLEFFLLNLDITGEVFGIISDDFGFLKQFNSYKDLENTTKIYYQNEQGSFNANIENLLTTKQKRILFNGDKKRLIDIHDELNRTEIGQSYVKYLDRHKNEEYTDSIQIMTNLKIFEYGDLISRLDKFKNFKFIDKVSTFYMAKKAKPYLVFLSVIFISFSTYFSYQFINTQAINYIYTSKIENLNNEIKVITKFKTDSEKKNFVPYYKPLNLELYKKVMNILNSMDLDSILKYNISFDNSVVNVYILTNNVKNVQYINGLKELSNLSLKSKKDNEEFEINFSYSNSKIPVKNKKGI